MDNFEKSDEMEIYFTVQQLIEELSKFPADMPVLTNGYEGGYENILQPYTQVVKHYPEKPYWDGEFGEFDEAEENEGFKALVLQRNQRSD